MQARVKDKIDKRGNKLRLTAQYLNDTIEAYIKECSNAKGELIKEPLLIEVALRLGIATNTLWEYSKRPDYAYSIKRIKETGELYLNRVMEADKANANSMFKLKTRHGYIEQQKIDVTSQGQVLGVIQLPTR